MRSDYKTYSDPGLLKLLAGGDEKAIRELFSRYWESLLTRATNFLCNEDAAKDCVQDVFISLWQHPDKTSILNLDHYLHQAVRFRAFRALRKNKNGYGFENRLSELEKRIFTENDLEFRELKSLLENLIASLPEDQRLIFTMHREEELTYRQIAEKLNISVKTVEKKMSRSLQYLRSNSNNALFLLLFFSRIP